MRNTPPSLDAGERMRFYAGGDNNINLLRGLREKEGFFFVLYKGQLVEKLLFLLLQQ